MLLAAGADLRVRIAGRGAMHDDLAGLIEPRFRDRVELLGHVEDMPAFYNDLDLFVLPSDAEGLPNALLEAMASGLPCIATRVGGVPEIFECSQYGVPVEPGDTGGLAGAIAQLAKDEGRRLDSAAWRGSEWSSITVWRGWSPCTSTSIEPWRQARRCGRRSSSRSASRLRPPLLRGRGPHEPLPRQARNLAAGGTVVRPAELPALPPPAQKPVRPAGNAASKAASAAAKWSAGR